jgi:uncharacterized protein YbjT (DUF2867 family)
MRIAARISYALNRANKRKGRHDMTILVTGATGNVGRLVVDHLRAAGAPVRALTRNPRRAALPAGVEVVQGYLGELDTLPPAFAGVEEMYLAPLARTVRDVVELATASGVRRIVALSQSDADLEAEGDEAGWHYHAIEKAVMDSGVDWTFLRPGQFFTNTLDWADEIRERGTVTAPYPNASYTPMDLDDIAAVAATVLLQGERHHGRKYPLTGPESLRKTDLVRIIGEVVGEEIRFVEKSREEAYREMYESGWGESAQWMLDLDARVTDNPEEVRPTVARILGRPPRGFAEWVAENAGRFRSASRSGDD